MRLWLHRNRLSAVASAAIGVIAVAAVVSRLPFLGTGEIDWDEGVYWLSMQSMQTGHTLFTSVYSSQPPAFLLFTEPPWVLLGAGIAAARAVMLGWGAVAILAGSMIGWRFGGRLAAVVVALTLAIDPLMVRQSVVLQAEGQATALGLVAAALAAIAVTTNSRRWTTVAAGLAGAALAIGFLTKFLDIAIVPPLVAALASRSGWRRLLLAATAGGLLAAAAILLPLHDAWPAMWNQTVGNHINARSLSSGISLLSALHLRWGLEVLAAAGAVVGWRRHRRLVLTGVCWVGGAVAAMAVTHPLWPHHAVAVSPGLALTCAAGASSTFAWLNRLGGRRSLAAATAFTVALTAAAAVYVASGIRGLQTTDDLRTVADALVERTSAIPQVLGDEQYAQALAHRAAPPAFVDTSNTRMYVDPGALQQLEAAANGEPPVCAVLFSSGRFAHLPGFTTWVANRYPVTISLGASRYLYIAPRCG